MSILIVDDSRLHLAALQAMLHEGGLTDVVMADSAAGALDALEKNPHIDLVLLDVDMPCVDGIAACRLIKGIDAYRYLPVIIVTALQEEDLLSKALDAGAIYFLKRPFGASALLARVRAAQRIKKEVDKHRARERDLLNLTTELATANSELRATNASLGRMAMVDGLTGLANRRYFDQTLALEWRRAQRRGAWLGLLMVDIDCFKAYNDAHGHQQGDRCLRRVAQAIRDCVSRPGDLAARYGGEEFAVILPGADPDGATDVARRVLTAVSALGLPHGHASVADHVTVSIGAAALAPGPGQEAATLIQTADQALYQAKSLGRNQVRACAG